MRLPDASVLNYVAREDAFWESATAYTLFYPSVTSAVASLDDDHPHAMTLIAMTAYGWMPRILKENFDPESFERKVRLSCLRRMDQGSAELWLDGMTGHPSPIDRSWIALSKVLHFVRPDLFPIFDSRIAASLGMPRNSPKLRNGKTYLSYFRLLHDSVERSELDGSIRDVRERIGDGVSKVRCLELLLFTLNGGLGSEYKHKRVRRSHG